MLQRLRGSSPKQSVFFDQQATRAAGMPENGRRRPAGRLDGNRRRERKICLHLGAFAEFAARPHAAAGLLCQHAAGRQTESGAQGFGGEKGLEDALAGERIHALAGVGHRETDGLWSRRGVGGRTHAPDRDRDLTAIRHRVAGVGHQVEQDLLERGGVEPDEHGFAVQTQANADGGPGQALRHLKILLDHFEQVCGFRLHRAPGSGMIQQLACEQGTALRGVKHAVEMRLLTLLAQAQRGQLGVAHDGAEDIVEVMRDPRAQAANQFQSLAARQRCFGFALRGDVDMKRDHVRHVAAAVRHR